MLIAGGVVAIVGLIAYLIVQAGGSTEDASAVPKAAQDDSPDIPGTYAPFLGVQHLSEQMNADYVPIMPYCEGVPHSGIREAALNSTGTPTPSQTPTSTATAVTTRSPEGTPSPSSDCYNSNPPSSGRHFGVQRNAEIAPGVITNIPPDPDVYPRDIDIPREAVAHIAEHAGVFVGYNCAQDDAACFDVVTQIEDVVNNRIDNHDDRVTMMYFSDLPVGEIGLASITRWDRFPYSEYEEDRVERFIAKNACRYDTEGFCQ